MRVRATLVDGHLVVPVPDLYAAHLRLEPGSLLELRATRDGFVVVASNTDDSPSGDERARQRAVSRIPTGADIARALGGVPGPHETPGTIASTSVSIDSGGAAELRALVDRHIDVLRSLVE